MPSFRCRGQAAHAPLVVQHQRGTQRRPEEFLAPGPQWETSLDIPEKHEKNMEKRGKIGKKGKKNMEKRGKVGKKGKKTWKNVGKYAANHIFKWERPWKNKLILMGTSLGKLEV